MFICFCLGLWGIVVLWNSFLCVLVHTRELSCWVYTWEWNCWERGYVCMFHQTIFQRNCTSSHPLAVHACSKVFTLVLMLVLSFSFCHLAGWEMISRCGFNLLFFDDQQNWALFHMYWLFALFCEVHIFLLFIGLSVISLLVYRLLKNMFWISVLYVLQISPSFCGLPFFSLSSIFLYLEVPNFNIVKFIIFFLYD